MGGGGNKIWRPNSPLTSRRAGLIGDAYAAIQLWVSFLRYRASSSHCQGHTEAFTLLLPLILMVTKTLTVRILMNITPLEAKLSSCCLSWAHDETEASRFNGHVQGHLAEPRITPQSG